MFTKESSTAVATTNSLFGRDLQLARALAVVAILVGSLDQLGWALRIPLLTQISPTFPTMKPLTAMCFILVGTSLLLLSFPRVATHATDSLNTPFHLLSIVLALAALTCSSLSLLEYKLGSLFGLDTLLFPSAVLRESSKFPGRMSIATATGISLLAISILLISFDKSGKRAWHQFTGIAAIATSLIGILRFAYGSDLQQTFAPFDTMALHTASICFLLSLSIFFVRPNSGLMATFNSPHLGGFFARRTLPVALTLPFLIGWMRLRAQQAGYFGTEFGLALFACSNSILFGLLLWGTARSLNSLDKRRTQADAFESSRRDVLQQIAEGRPLSSILEKIVLLVESQEPSVRCSILLYNAEANTLLDGAAPSLPDAYRKAIHGISVGPEVGSCGTAAFLKRRVIVEDVATHPYWAAFKDLALSHGLRSCWSSPILSASGELLGTFAVYSDKSGPPKSSEFSPVDAATALASIAIERCNSEYALRENQTQLQFLFDHAGLGIVLVTPSGKIIKCNPAFCNLIGYSEAELQHAGNKQITHEDDAQADDDRNEALRNSSSASSQFVKRYKHKSGRILYANLNVSIVRNQAGAPLYGIEIVEDITARHIAEAESAKAQAQLEQSQRLQALGTLAGGIAHDFNNILGSILGNVEFALSAVEPTSRVRSSLDRISEASSRASDLVRQILAFSRLQAVRRRPIRLQPIIEESLKLLRSTLPAMVEIQTVVDVRTPEILADPTQIYQVIMNLGTNAAQAMAKQGGCLRVNLATEELANFAIDNLPAGHYARLTVSDTGIGMDASTLSRVFEPFFTTKSQGEGTGLGLAVVHGIVSSCGGAIQLSSTPGAGTHFEIYFPVSTQSADAPHESSTLAATASRGSGERILLIDDEKSLLEISQFQLEQNGYRVSAFSDPFRALEEFSKNPQSFDAVMTDLSMPSSSGLELASAIRALRQDIPIILSSGFFQTQDQEAAMKCGVNEFLTKPYPSSALLATVSRALSASQVSLPPQT